MASKTKPGPRCSVCAHPERHRIEMLRLAGTTGDVIAERFGLGRDAVYRHMQRHVSAAMKGALIADVPLKELADRAAAEGVSLLDYIHIVRSTVMSQMLGAASINDRMGTAALAGRALDVIREAGKLTGEILRSAPVQNVTHNTAIFMSSPVYGRLERMLLDRLAPHPDALRAVLDGLQELEGDQPPSGPLLTALPIAEGYHAA